MKSPLQEAREATKALRHPDAMFFLEYGPGFSPKDGVWAFNFNVTLTHLHDREAWIKEKKRRFDLDPNNKWPDEWRIHIIQTHVYVESMKMSVSEFVWHTFRTILHAMVLHEADEMLLVGDDNVFNPHNLADFPQWTTRPLLSDCVECSEFNIQSGGHQ